MIKRVTVQRFKMFSEQTFELEDQIVLAGPNNSGKSTLIQAITVWQLALRKWNQEKGTQGKSKAKERVAIPITRKDFTAVPLREMKLLWTDTSTSYRKGEDTQRPGYPKTLTITVEGVSNGSDWSLGFEFRFQSSEQIYVKPLPENIDHFPEEALGVNVVHVPPFSGIGAEETRYDKPYQDLLVGQGKPGDILRNLLLEVYQGSPSSTIGKGAWDQLVALIKEVFGYELLPPRYEGHPYIICEYESRGRGQGASTGSPTRLDISSAGSGFHQVLLLLAFFFARPSSVLLLDEPDAHLHVMLQKQLYERLRSIAASRRCQLIVATHSEVMIDATSPDRIESFFGEPHRLVTDTEKNQVRQALKLVTATELLLVERSGGVLYVEGDTDVTLLTAWARVLRHPALPWLEGRGFVRPLTACQPKLARDHFFALQGVSRSVKGFLLLDGDNKRLTDREMSAEGLHVARWKRYEAESYLFHPEALRRFVAHFHGGDIEPNLLSIGPLNNLNSHLEENFAPAILRDPLGDHPAHSAMPFSKEQLPAILSAAGIDLPKRDYFRLADMMRPQEIAQDVVTMLDAIHATFGSSESD